MTHAHDGSPIRVGIVGAGAAGTLTALHLTRLAAERCRRFELTLADPARGWAGSSGFGTTDPGHLLNVPAMRMSAFPDDPDDFVTWRRSQGLGNDPGAFAPRREFAGYLRQRFEEARGASPQVRVTRTRRSIHALARSGGGVTLTDSEGTEHGYDAAVLALGLPRAGTAWAPPALLASPRFVADPWAPGALDVVRRDRSAPADVLVVGTGLTMVDVALTLTAPNRDRRPARVIHAISRGGRLPAVHAREPLTAVIPDVSGWGDSLPRLRALALAHVSAARRTAGDWRAGVDGLRQVIGDLWERLSEADRATFLARDAGRWGAARHRMAPSSGEALAGLRRDGLLTLAADRIGQVSPIPGGGLDVHLAGGRHVQVGWVINCTGPHPDLRTAGDPLIDDLLRERDGAALALPATAGLGVRTRSGRLRDGAGSTATPLWTLGALRRGELWESTAVPEIRCQAQAVAEAVLREVPAPRRHPAAVPGRAVRPTAAAAAGPGASR